MKLLEALQIVRRTPAGAPPFEAMLVCGSTPLHLETLFAAHLQKQLPERKVSVRTGLYGDLSGAVKRLADGDTLVQALAIVLEWPDLDGRLGFRQTGGWSPGQLSDIAASARQKLGYLQRSIERIPGPTLIALSLPALALPPVSYMPGWQWSDFELGIEVALLDFAIALAARRVRLLNPSRLNLFSAAAARQDTKSNWLTGFPYTMEHAGVLGEALARLIAPDSPKKGLISDLDDTMWRGIVGEVGPEEVHWDLDHHAQGHGLYQQTLAALAEQGVLLAVASKNDARVVERAFERVDLQIAKNRIFPWEVHWNKKSGSVARILETWNIGASSIVFVDDSPMEVAEVRAAFPDMECIVFPKDNPAEIERLLYHLRDVFGKERIGDEDALRLDSIRAGAAVREAQFSGEATPDAFLEQAQGVVTVELVTVVPGAGDPRVLELVNKTNQFNLNGVRYTEPDWQAAQSRPGAFVAAVSYRDKFGNLGKIAVIGGCVDGEALRIDTWVLSCRAFSRRIEHQCLRSLFDHFNVRHATLKFAPTARNGPLQEFLATLMDDSPAGHSFTASASPFEISRQQFEEKCPTLHHRATLHPPEPKPA